MSSMNRRQCLSAMAGAGVAASFPNLPVLAAESALRVETRTLDIYGKAARVWGITGPGGRQGLVLGPGERFRVSLENGIDQDTLVHWHGQTPPYEQDGVPDISQPALEPGGAYRYDYEARPGTYWMHSHVGLQSQKLLSAPLIVRSAGDAKTDIQDVTLFLHDFSFREPEEIMADLKSGKLGHGDHMMAAKMPEEGVSHDHSHGAEAMPMSGEGMGHSQESGHQMDGTAMELNDVEYDAFLANDRTLDDPDVVRVEKGARVRLRIINAAASTNFWIVLGELSGELVAVDGNDILPVEVGHVPLAMAQRADIVVTIPKDGGAWPVLALREGGTERAGVVLATKDAHVHRVPLNGDKKAGPLHAHFENHLTAGDPLPKRKPDRMIHLTLTGGMHPYVWGINGKPWGEHDVLEPKQGVRLRLMFENKTGMSHPMHLHGHHFQISALNGQAMTGAIRDTVLVPARGGTVAVDFDAGHGGRWLLHCHNAYHMGSGMMTELRYGV